MANNLNKGLYLRPSVEGSQPLVLEVLDVQLRGFPDTGVVLVVNFFCAKREAMQK